MLFSVLWLSLTMMHCAADASSYTRNSPTKMEKFIKNKGYRDKIFQLVYPVIQNHQHYANFTRPAIKFEEYLFKRQNDAFHIGRRSKYDGVTKRKHTSYTLDRKNRQFSDKSWHKSREERHRANKRSLRNKKFWIKEDENSKKARRAIQTDRQHSSPNAARISREDLFNNKESRQFSAVDREENEEKLSEKYLRASPGSPSTSGSNISERSLKDDINLSVNRFPGGHEGKFLTKSTGRGSSKSDAVLEKEARLRNGVSGSDSQDNFQHVKSFEAEHLPEVQLPRVLEFKPQPVPRLQDMKPFRPESLMAAKALLQEAPLVDG